MAKTKSFLDLLATSRISILGAILVTTAIGADAMLIIGELLIFESNPYIGIIAYVLFPGIAAFGLVLIPLGILLRIRKSHHDPVGMLVRQLSRMKVLRLIFSLTMINFVVFAFFGYRSIHFMESAEFCGTVCHEVMIPEYTVYQRSPHSEVHCVNCHVGSGVGWLIKSKLDGTRQLAGVILDNYARPIQTPVHNMRPAPDICEACHSSESYQGDRVKTIEHFDSDELNTRSYSILNLHLGNDGEDGKEAQGIHWHNSTEHEIRFYSTNHQREEIVRVELITNDGEMRVWTRPQSQGNEYELDHMSVRVMDCVDCHNRPAHIFLPPDRVLDNLLGEALINPAIPWIRAMAEEVFTKEYSTHDEAMAGITKLPELYEIRYPTYWFFFADDVRDAVPVLQSAHETYVYPSMKIGWNTYPSLIGHPTAHTSACFRCHDGVLVDEAGIQITNDCNSCHVVLAEDEQDPIILRMLEDR